MTDASGTTNYVYDSRNRLASKQTPNGTLTYTYDAGGNLKTTRSNNTGGVSVDYSYDQLNRLKTVKDNRLVTNQTTTYNYDAAGNLLNYVYPNAVTTAYTYNSLNRLTNLTVKQGATTLSSYAYTLGAAGNRTQVVENGNRTVAYTYDDLYRLTRETITNDPASNNGQVGYVYDPVGNRQSRTSTVSAIPTQSFSYDANDRVTSDTFDQNGNTVQQNGNSYNFDFENKLTSLNNGQTTFVYDGDGNRVSKTTSGVTTKFLVDTNNHTGYAQVVEEIVAGNVSKQFTFGHDLISQRAGANVNFYQYDGHGSVRSLTNTSGAITDTYTYDAFGNLINRTGTTPNDYLYAGEQFDANLGFYYLRARYMNPSNGRFHSMDSFEGNLFEPASLHKYLYADADPVNLIDPSGEFSIELNIRIAISNVLSSMSGLQVAATTLALRVTLFSSAGVSFIVGRGNQAITVLRNTGEQGVRSWQNLMLQSNRIVTLAESRAAGSSPSFTALKEFLNRTIMGTRANPPDIQWHHLVEQRAANVTQFGNNAINSTANLVPTNNAIHTRISAFYSSAPPWVRNAGFSRVRDWMEQQTWERQYEAGLQIWQQAMRNLPVTWQP